MTTQAEFIQAHAVDGRLTDEQMAQLLELPEGDTSTPLESGEPAATSGDTAAADSGAQVATNESATSGPEPASEAAVVMAKDGVHTIPYQKLVDARDGEKHWKAQAEAAQLELEALKAQAQQRSDAGQSATATDKAVAVATAAIESGTADPEIFGDFSEAALAKGIQQLVAMGVQQATAQLRGELSSAVAPLQQKQAQTAKQEHYSAIYARHADADSIVESQELAEWINRQPSFARSGYQAVIANGTAAEVIELFDSFKAETEKTQPPATPRPDVAAVAKAAIAGAKPAVPASLSDIPGGTAGPVDEMEAMRQMTGSDLLGRLEGKSPEQVAALMARLL